MKISLRGVLGALVLLVAGPGFLLGSAPAAGAATCTSSGGVSVVVDYRELGGATVTACAADGAGKSAAAIFDSVGVSLSYATRQPGFVCRVNGVPTSDPCVNASPSNAYWGLWWADGSKASWTYSSYGAASLTVPAGGSVGWSWQQDRTAGTTVPPAVAPPVTAASTPSPTPTSSPTSSPSAPASSSPTATPSGSASSSPSGSSSPSPSSSPTSGPAGGPGGGPGGSPSSGSSPQATPSGSPSASESPLAPESPGDSRGMGGSGKPSHDPSVASESPGDSHATKDAEAAESPSESPSDSGASDAAEAGSPAPDEPSRVPAALTWSIVGLLAAAIAGSAVVARRRRGV